MVLINTILIITIILFFICLYNLELVNDYSSITDCCDVGSDTETRTAAQPRRARTWLCKPSSRQIFAFCTGRFTIIAHPTITCFVTIWQWLFFAFFMYVCNKNTVASSPPQEESERGCKKNAKVFQVRFFCIGLWIHTFALEWKTNPVFQPWVRDVVSYNEAIIYTGS